MRENVSFFMTFHQNIRGNGKNDSNEFPDRGGTLEGAVAYNIIAPVQWSQVMFFYHNLPEGYGLNLPQLYDVTHRKCISPRGFEFPVIIVWQVDIRRSTS